MADPSGAFVPYAAVAIGAGSDEVNTFLEKNYEKDIGLDSAATLTISAINQKRQKSDDAANIKMARVTAKTCTFEKIQDAELSSYAKNSGT